MTRKFKVLGLAPFATLAMGAVMASAASATEFTAEKYPVTYSGYSLAGAGGTLTVDGFEVKCEESTLSGEAQQASTTVTLSPTFSQCTAFGLSSSVTMNGCDFLLHLGTTGGDATVDLVCPAGKDVTIDAGGGACVSHIPSFTGKAKVALSNVHPNIEGKATVSGIKVSLTDVSSFFCPFAGSTTVENATFSGEATVTGSSTIDIG